MNSYNQKILYFSLLIISVTASAGALVYRIYSLNNLGVFLSIFLAAIGVFIILFFTKKSNKIDIACTAKNASTEVDKNSAFINAGLIFLYLISISSLFFLLFKNQTVSSIISPWEVLPAKFFIIYFLASALLLFTINNNSRWSTLLISLHCFLSFTIAIIVFKIGFGFDTFIHEATLKLIDQTGLVTPKPFYYLSFYSLVILAHKIFFLPIAFLNKFLVPFLAALFLPVTLISVLKNIFNDRRQAQLITLLFLIFPFSIFTLSTPQNFAFLFLLLMIFLSLNANTKKDFVLLYLLAFTSFLAQPIAGIPALLFAFIVNFHRSNFSKIKKTIIALAYSAVAISLPLALFIFEKNNGTTNTATAPEKISNYLKIPGFVIPGQEDFILNFVYLYTFNIQFIISLLIIFSLYLVWRYRQQYRNLWLYAGMSGSLLIAYGLAKFLPFNFLIAYEKDDFLNRILIAAILFLLPVIALNFFTFLNKLTNQKKLVRYIVYFFILFLLSASFYSSYPRFDRYYNSRSYSTGQADIDAVRWINDDSHSQNYIVLANQQVSAAALSQFGFKKYYRDNLFYYPIPTNSPLYQYYLDMVYEKPTKKTMVRAMDLAGANESYFVLNKYWWQFPKVLAEAKFSADSWQEFGNGEIFVFKYSK
jgi:hypothetical protein